MFRKLIRLRTLNRKFGGIFDLLKRQIPFFNSSAWIDALRFRMCVSESR